MKKTVICKWFFSGMVISMLLWSCATVPITGRKQLNLLAESELMSLSLTQYKTFLNENKLSDDRENALMVQRVGKRIAAAVESFLSENGMSDRIKDFEWEFNLVEDDTPNAWCMPGGKVVVYTGILPFTRTENGLAVVMGHEIAHAIARHGNERMSQQLGVQLGGAALSVAMDEKSEETQDLFLSVYGVGSQLFLMLPYSRTHETEADKMGLVFMSMAGYNPREAVDFWERMSNMGGQKPPQFLSTHPADQTRIKDLKAYLPEALKYYKAP